MLHYTSQAPSHPGSYLQELLLWRQVSAREFGDVTGIGESKVVDIIKRRRAIDKNVSEGLAAYFGNSSGFWLDLQAHFVRRPGPPLVGRPRRARRRSRPIEGA